MACNKGIDGVVKVGGVTVAEVRGWNLTETSGLDDATVMNPANAGYKVYCPSFKEWNGTLNCLWSPDDAGQTPMVNGATVTLRLYPSDEGTGKTYYEGSAIVTSIEHSAEVEGLVNSNFNFTGSGPLTIATDP